MHIKEAAARVGTSERMLRHYEKEGLLEPHRTENGYRSYSEVDVRRAKRIRDLVVIGFSTREVRALAPCLSDQGASACEGGLVELKRKLDNIDQLRAELDRKRDAVLQRMAEFRAALDPGKNASHAKSENGHPTSNGKGSDDNPRVTLRAQPGRDRAVSWARSAKPRSGTNRGPS